MRVEHYSRIELCEDAARRVIGTVGRMLDVGCGIRPACDWLPCRSYYGLDGHAPYLVYLARDRPALASDKCVLPDDLPLPYADDAFDVGVLSDVVEHLFKPAGFRVLFELLRVCRAGVVVRTPDGFVQQDGHNAWGMGPVSLQRHRSGWTEHDFRGLATHQWRATGQVKVAHLESGDAPLDEPRDFLTFWLPKEVST